MLLFEMSVTSDFDARTAVERALVLRLARLLWVGRAVCKSGYSLHRRFQGGYCGAYRCAQCRRRPYQQPAHRQAHGTLDVTPEMFDERIAVNLRHAFFAAQAVLPGMQANGGGVMLNLLVHVVDGRDGRHAHLAFLASDDASCTAQDYVVDAGWV